MKNFQSNGLSGEDLDGLVVLIDESAGDHEKPAYTTCQCTWTNALDVTKNYTMFSRLHTISGRFHTISSKLHCSNPNSCRLNPLSNNLHNSIKSNAPSKRLYSVRAKKTPTFRDLFHTPVFKTLFLTLVFGSVVVECTKNRKEVEGLQAAYGAKNRVLREVTHKIKAKEPVDVASELSVANSMTRNKYHSVTDVQLDQSFEDFLKMADDDLDMAFEVEEQGYVPEPQLASSSERKNTSKFL